MYRNIDRWFCFINNQKFEMYQMLASDNLLNLRSNTRQEAKRLLLTLIYSFRSGRRSPSHFYLILMRWFYVTIFPFLSCNKTDYGVFISHLLRYARTCFSHWWFILRPRRRSNKLLKQGYIMKLLKSLFRKLYARYADLIKHYEVSLSQM